MARGANAKINVMKALEKAFGANYIGEVDKKIYVWADDGGERVQIALAMTCPKTFVDAPEADIAISDSTNKNNSVPATGWNFEDTPVPVPAKKPATISKEEEDNIIDLMARLGL